MNFESLANRNIKHIRSVRETVVELNISNNPIRHLPNTKSLRKLIARNTDIRDLRGVIESDTLENISMEGTPISGYRYFRVMLLIAVSGVLRVINHRDVSDGERRLAKRLKPIARGYIIAGWILTGISPMKMLNPATMRRLIVYKGITDIVKATPVYRISRIIMRRRKAPEDDTDNEAPPNELTPLEDIVCAIQNKADA